MTQQTLGLRHLALSVQKLEETVKFYQEHLGMHIEWQPDNDNYYLSSGQDNLALHRAKENFSNEGAQRLDHLGFILPSLQSVDDWYERFLAADIKIAAQPKTHRDGARSFYCYDPDGNTVQMIYHPPLAG